MKFKLAFIFFVLVSLLLFSCKNEDGKGCKSYKELADNYWAVVLKDDTSLVKTKFFNNDILLKVADTLNKSLNYIVENNLKIYREVEKKIKEQRIKDGVVVDIKLEEDTEGPKYDSIKVYNINALVFNGNQYSFKMVVAEYNGKWGILALNPAGLEGPYEK